MRVQTHAGAQTHKGFGLFDDNNLVIIDPLVQRTRSLGHLSQIEGSSDMHTLQTDLTDHAVVRHNQLMRGMRMCGLWLGNLVSI